MRRHEKELDRLGVKVVVVTFEQIFPALAYVKKTSLQWPLLVDEKRSLYRAYGMLNAGLLDLWGPATWWAYMKEMARGRLPKKPTGDVNQRGGDVLVDPSGIIRLHHVGKGPADRPPVASILRRIEKVG
ncbi:MAG: redoxin domain-containing protein [Acidobacteria bacterium]|nr:redoxin domain-containing protein [Acidobacteriota bacterium]